MPADLATPLAVVLAELLQNSVEHAFPDAEPCEDPAGRPAPASAPEGSGPAGLCPPGPLPPGHVLVHLVNDLTSLVLEVVDDGVGLPPGFDIEATQSLGLSIVRDLVRSQLDGSITMRPRTDGTSGTVVSIEVPYQEGPPLGL